MTTFTLLSRPRCYVVQDDSIFIHTVIVHAHTIEVHTEALGGSDYNPPGYDKYRRFANWMRFADAMPGTAKCIEDNNPVHTVFPFQTGG